MTLYVRLFANYCLDKKYGYLFEDNTEERFIEMMENIRNEVALSIIELKA